MIFRKKKRMIDLTKNKKDEVIEASARSRSDLLKERFFEVKPRNEDISEKLDRITKKLNELEERLGVIERKLSLDSSSNKGLISW